MEQIGPYVLRRRIGAGGMAEVWEAQRASMGARKTVALKLLAPHLADDARYRAMFLAEARLSMLLNHSNIAQVFDVGEDRGECFMAMEWIDGANLAELQASLWEHGHALSIGAAMYVTAELLRALAHAHALTHERAQTLVHRDVSPANVMVSRAGEVKLTDFGVARFASDETSGLHVKGKLRYMAPEQLQGESRSGAVDLFAVGAVLHEMLTGEKFRGRARDEAELIGMVCEGLVPEQPSPPAIPAALERLRRALLAPRADQRPASAQAALEQLSACPGFRHAAVELGELVRWRESVAPRVSASASGSRARSPAARVPPPASPPASRRASAVRLVAGLGLLVVGTGVGGLGLSVAVRGAASEAAVASAAASLGRRASQASRQRASAIARALPRPSPSREPVAAPASASTPAPALSSAPTPAPLAASQPEPAPTIEPEPEPEPRPRKRSEPAPAPDPVAVRFVAGQLRYAYVKVAGRELLLEPSASVELAPGRHRVDVRSSPDQPWTRFGQVRVRPDHPITIELVPPASLAVRPPR